MRVLSFVWPVLASVLHQAVSFSDGQLQHRLHAHHHHHKHCPPVYHEWQTLPLPPPIPHFWNENLQPDYVPVKVETYPGPTKFPSSPDTIEDKSLMEPTIIGKDSIVSQEIFAEPNFYPYRSVSHDQPVMYRVRKKPKSKKRKKKPRPVSSMLFPTNVASTTPKYSINKIIVIDDSDNIPRFKDEPQLERPLIDEPKSVVHFKDPYVKPTEPLPAPYTFNTGKAVFENVPLKSIQDVHQRLNQTLLSKESKPEIQPIASKPATIPSLAEFLSKLPPTTNLTLAPNGNSTSSSHFTQSSDFFVKANKFAFQNSWNSHSSSTEAPKPEAVATTERLIPSDSGVNRHWHSTTLPPPPVYYFTSQRSVLPTPPPITASSTFITPKSSPAKQIDSEMNFAARKRGQHQHYYHHHHQESIANIPLNMTKVVSIIIGFCVSMMLLAGELSVLVRLAISKKTFSFTTHTLRYHSDCSAQGYRDGTLSKSGRDDRSSVSGSSKYEQ